MNSTPNAQGGRGGDATPGDDCPECGGPLAVDDERGERTCRNCGLVVESDRIDHGPEWREFDDDSGGGRRRTGRPRSELKHDHGLSTVIGKADRDGHGNTLSGKKRARASRLRTWDRRCQMESSQDRTLWRGFTEIERMSTALGVPKNTQEIAGAMFRQAVEKEVLLGRSIEDVASACVYAASREAGHPRTLDDIEPVSHVERVDIARGFRKLRDRLGLELEPADPGQYVPRIVSELDVDGEEATLEREARRLLDATAGTYHSGKKPSGLAAAAVYAATIRLGGDATQEDVAAAANVTDVTIRHHYEDMLAAVDE